MADPAQLQSMLTNLQAQISAISGMAQQPVTQAAPQMLNSIQPDIFSMVKTAVQSEMSRLGLGNNISPTPTAIATQQQNMNTPNIQSQNPVAAILPIIGAAFTQEQQEWISQPQNLISIPGFLMSADGKSLLNMALESFQQFTSQQK